MSKIESFLTTPTVETTPDPDQLFESIERAEALSKDLSAKVAEARSRGAVKVGAIKVETVGFDFDPHGIDPESRQQGVIVEKRTAVQLPNSEYSDWEVPAGEDASYQWRIETNPDNAEQPPRVSIESPLDLGHSDVAGIARAAVAGVKIEGRRIQEYVVGTDGKVYGRSADYSVVGGNTRNRHSGSPYRLITGSQRQWLATEGEVSFIEDSMHKTTLVSDTRLEQAA